MKVGRNLNLCLGDIKTFFLNSLIGILPFCIDLQQFSHHLVKNINISKGLCERPVEKNHQTFGIKNYKS